MIVKLLYYNTADTDFNKLRSAIYDCDGACDTMAKTMTDNVSGGLKELASAAEDAQIEIYEAAKPMIEDALPGIKDFFIWIKSNAGNIANILKPVGGTLQTALALLKPIGAVLSPILWLVGKFTGGITDLFSYIAGSESEIENYNGTLSECRTEIEQTELALEKAKERYGENSDAVKSLESDLELLNKQYEKGGGYLAELSEQADAASEAFKEMSTAQSDAMDAIDDTQVQGLRAVSMLESLSSKTQLTSADLDTMSKYADYLNDTFNCNIVVDYDTGEITGFDPKAVTKSIIDAANDNKVQQSIDYLTNPEFTDRYVDAYKRYEELMQKRSNLQKEYDQRYKNADYGTFVYDEQFGKVERELELTNAELETVTSSLNTYDAELDKYGGIAEESGFSTDLFRESLRETAKSGDELISSVEKQSDTLTEQQQGIDAAKEKIESYSEEIYKIAEAYDKAYESAYNSISNQFSLFSEAKNDADATFDAFMNATDSQLDFWDTYNSNLETLRNKSYKDLGITEENYNLLLDLAAKTDTESQSLINSILVNGDTAIAGAANRLGELKEAHEKAATNQATELTGIEDELKKHVDNIKDAIKNLKLGAESKRYAEGTMDEYIRGIEGKIEKARGSAQSLVDAVKSTFESADLTLTMSVVSTSASGSVQVEGNAKGTTNSADVFIAGEEGPELIVGKKGSTVFPFSETAKIVRAVSNFSPGLNTDTSGLYNRLAAPTTFPSRYDNYSSSSSTSSQPVSVPDLHPTFNVTVNLGNGEFRDYVIDTVTDANANSGGWSV
ncbi:MAG: hypothetical protein K2H01_02470 [Ruminococcus sp.]|nr:hypothetical protein [Ruminococcus sp.]